MSKENIPALNREAIFGKSKKYILKALRAKDSNDLEEYQLWASLALELLGKAALASVHPSLIVDPQHSESLFAASGISIKTDIKTINGNTLFARLKYLSHRFDNGVKNFCDTIAQRRNAELHSGELSFKFMNLAWEERYWHAAEIILECMNFSLEDWLGASKAKVPQEIMAHTTQARISVARIKVEEAKKRFLSQKSTEIKKRLLEASAKHVLNYSKVFSLFADHEWEITCPACTAKALLAGMQCHEEVLKREDCEEMVEQLFSAEEFYCPVCELHLYNHDEIEAIGIETVHSECKTRERAYEPEWE